MSRKFFNFPIIFLKIGPLRPRRRFSLAKQEKVWHNKCSVKRCPPESISRSAQAHNFIFGDVPKRLKGLHSKCSRGVKARESSNLTVSANPLKSSVSAGSFCFYTDCSLPHRNMDGYFLWPFVRILYSIFECYGA